MKSDEYKIFALGTSEQKSGIFDETLESLGSVSESERFLSLIDLRVFFFHDASSAQKRKYVKSILTYLSGGNFSAQYVELLGVLFKYVDPDLQDEIAERILSVANGIVKTVMGVVALLNFYKNAHRLFSEKTDEKFVAYIEQIRSSVPPRVDDTFEYILKNRLREFTQSNEADALIIIPEFLSGASFLQMPIALMSAKAQMEKRGIICDLLDNRVYSYGLKQIAAITRKYKYVIVCSSTVDQVQNYFLDYRYDVFCMTVRTVKTLQSTVIACGAHGSVKPQLVMNDAPVDYLIDGEFDFQLADLLCALKNGNAAKVANIYYRDGDTVRYTYRDESKLHPLEWCNEAVPYGGVNYSDYFGYDYFENTHVKKTDWGIMQTSRGCPYKCAFCYDFYQKKVRFKNIDIVLSEIGELIKGGISEVFFIDQTFTLDRAYTMNLCNAIISSGFNFAWRCETRVDLLDEELLKVMKRAGCTQIWLGVESLDETVLKKNDKNYGIDTLNEVIAEIEAAGISYCVFIMLGMVGETAKSARKTVDEIIKRNMHTTRSIITFTPRFGTQVLRDSSLFDNIDIDKLDFHALYYLKGSVANTIGATELAYELSRLVRYVSN